MSPRLRGSFIVIDAPTTPEVVEPAVVRSILERNGTADGRLKLGAPLARLLRQEMAFRQGLLSEPDRKVLQALVAFTDGWNEMERAFWRARAFHEARARKPRPYVANRRREPQAREARPSRRQRTASTTRDGPSSSSSSDEDDPHDLARQAVAA